MKLKNSNWIFHPKRYQLDTDAKFSRFFVKDYNNKDFVCFNCSSVGDLSLFYYVKSEDIPFKRFADNKIRASLLCGCGCRFNVCSGDIMSYYDEPPEKISKYIDEISKKADEWVEDYINNKVSKLTEYDIIKLVNDMATQSLPPELYNEWVSIMFYLKNNRNIKPY